MGCVAPRLSPAALSPLSLACVCASPSLSRRACATHAIRVFWVCCRVQYGNLPLHNAAGNNSEAVIKALLDAYPDAIKAKTEVRCGHGRRVLCPLLSLLTCVCCRVQGGLPLHIAAAKNESEAVIKALLDAYPDAAKAKDKVRCGRGRRVLCPLLSHLSLIHI